VAKCFLNEFETDALGLALVLPETGSTRPAGAGRHEPSADGGASQTVYRLATDTSPARKPKTAKAHTANLNCAAPNLESNSVINPQPAVAPIAKMMVHIATTSRRPMMGRRVCFEKTSKFQIT
jgi:hypothetical protein